MTAQAWHGTSANELRNETQSNVMLIAVAVHTCVKSMSAWGRKEGRWGAGHSTEASSALKAASCTATVPA